MTEFDEFVESTQETLQEAVAATLDKKRRLGQYAIVCHDGEILRMVPDPPILGEWKMERDVKEVVRDGK